MNFELGNLSQENLDYRELLKHYIRHWKWFVIIGLITLLSGFLYIRYTVPQYAVQAKIQILEEVNAIIKDFIFDTIIHRNSKIGESPSAGLPVILYDASSKGTSNFLNLANEFLKKNKDSIFDKEKVKTKI